MTGEKDRFTTHEKLWKLEDNTLSTPEHDEMVLWLLNKENAKIIPEIQEFYKNNSKWTQRRVINESKWDNEAPINDLINIDNFWDILKEPSFRIIESIIETMINKKIKDSDGWTSERYTKHKQDIKQIYLNKWYNLKNDYDEGQETVLNRDIILSSEKPIITYNKFIIGYWDIVVNFKIGFYNNNHFLFWDGKEKDDRFYNELPEPVYIEAKPKIKSFGATLRQLNTYRNYINKQSVVYLFTKDTQFKEAFESQGIKILLMPEPKM